MKITKDLKTIIAIFLLLKVIFIVIGAGSHYLPIGTDYRANVTDNLVLNDWLQYDTLAYLDIVKNGYNDQFNNGNYGFYPFYPLLIKIFGFLGYGLSAFLVSNIASIFAVVFMYLLIKEEFDEKTAKKAMFYLLLFPTAYFLTAAYTESIFLLLSLIMFYYARKEKWLYVGIAGFFIAMTRIQGVMLFIPMLYIYLSKRDAFSVLNGIKKIDFKIAYLSLIPLGIIAFFTYLYFLTSDFFIHFHSHTGFGRVITYPWVSFLVTFRDMANSTSIISTSYFSFNLFMTVFFVLLLVKSFKYLKMEYSLYLLFSMLIPISSSTLQAIGRFELVMFPAFIVMAKLSERKRNDILLKVLYVFFVALLVLFIIWHVNGGFKIPNFN